MTTSVSVKTPIYSAVLGSRFSEAAIVEITPDLHQIFRSTGGHAPASIVERARDKNSALHKHFEWNNTIAGEAHRITQARELVRAINVTIIVKGCEAPIKTRALVHVYDGDVRVYRPIGEVLDNPDDREAFLLRALRELEVLQRKYQVLTQLEEGFAAVRRDRASTQKEKPKEPGIIRAK